MQLGQCWLPVPCQSLHTLCNDVHAIADHFEITPYLESLSEEIVVQLGGVLGLSYNKFQKMKTYPDDMVAAWLRREDGVLTKSGEPSWRMLVKALRTIHQEGIARNIEKGEKLRSYHLEPAS